MLFQLSQFTLFIGYQTQRIFDREYRSANFREWLSAVSMPFVPEDTAKECNKKPRVQKKRERGLFAREMPERKKKKKILALQ